MIFKAMDKNTIFAKLFRLTPFAYDIPAFIDFMAEYGHAVKNHRLIVGSVKPAAINRDQCRILFLQ